MYRNNIRVIPTTIPYTDSSYKLINFTSTRPGQEYWLFCMQSEMIICTVATSAPKTKKKEKEKKKTFHKLCFQASLEQYEGTISRLSPGQLKVANQPNRMHRSHPGLLGCSSIHSINTVKQKPAQETHSYAIQIRHSPFYVSPSSLSFDGSVAICFQKMLLV